MLATVIIEGAWKNVDRENGHDNCHGRILTEFIDMLDISRPIHCLVIFLKEYRQQKQRSTSTPLSSIEPEVTSYFGWPMMTKPSVLLPLPLGPIRAWVSPFLMVKLTPFKMGVPSTATCRSVIFSVSVIGVCIGK